MTIGGEDLPPNSMFAGSQVIQSSQQDRWRWLRIHQDCPARSVRVDENQARSLAIDPQIEFKPDSATVAAHFSMNGRRRFQQHRMSKG